MPGPIFGTHPHRRRRKFPALMPAWARRHPARLRLAPEGFNPRNIRPPTQFTVDAQCGRIMRTGDQETMRMGMRMSLRRGAQRVPRWPADNSEMRP
jgi:hypothetical protein